MAGDAFGCTELATVRACLADANAQCHRLLDRIDRAAALLAAAPHPYDLHAIAAANQAAWVVLTEGRDPDSQRHGNAVNNSER